MALDFTEVDNRKPKAKKAKLRAITLIEKLDIQPIQKDLEQYKPQLAELEKQANELKVIDMETFQVSVDGAATAKGLVKAIDGKKAEQTGPYREFINKVNNAAKFFTDPFKKIAETFSRKGGDYQYQLQLAEAKQRKIIEEESRKLQERLNKQAAKDNIPAPKVIDVVPPKPETVIHTQGGHSQHLRKQWVGEIEDPEKVPKEYCIPDQRLINQAVRMGVRSIEGVKIYEKVSAVHR